MSHLEKREKKAGNANQMTDTELEVPIKGSGFRV
jgi:hypothetical protein